MLNKNVVKPAQAERALLIVFVSKERRQFLKVFRPSQTNAMTKQNSYLIPLLEKSIDIQGNATVFSTLYTNSINQKVEIGVASSDKTAFTSHHELFQTGRMPFRLRNPSGAFQKTIDIIVSAVKSQFALVHLDNIVVFFKSSEKYAVHVCTVLTLLGDANATLKLKKFQYSVQVIDHLGHVIYSSARELCLTRRAQIANSSPSHPKLSLDHISNFLTFFDDLYQALSE